MRICIIAPLVAPLGPASPGGAERVALDIAEGFAELGHSVQIIACSGSVIPQSVTYIDLGIETGDLTPLQTGKTSFREISTAKEVFDKLANYLRNNYNNFDIVHLHPSDREVFLLNTSGIPTVQTVHLDPQTIGLQSSPALNEGIQKRTWIAPSCYLAQQFVPLGITPKVIHNGTIQLDSKLHSTDSSNTLLWVGRISPEKGLLEAIKVAHALNRTLHIIGKAYDLDYFARCQKQWQGKSKFVYYGFLSRSEVQEIMAKVSVLLMPSKWDEPFGTVLLESLAVGTPAIAFNRGGNREIIEDGKTGFLVNTVEEMIEAVLQIPTISRKDCSHSVQQKFSLETMLQKYEELFSGIIAKKKNQVHLQ